MYSTASSKQGNITSYFRPSFRIYLCLIFTILLKYHHCKMRKYDLYTTLFCFSPEIREYPKIKGCFFPTLISTHSVTQWSKIRKKSAIKKSRIVCLKGKKSTFIGFFFKWKGPAELRKNYKKTLILAIEVILQPHICFWTIFPIF